MYERYLMYEPMKMVREFNEAFKVKHFIDQPDQFSRRKMLELRLALIEEEFREVQDELLDAMNGSGDWMRLAKELSDLLYHIYGTGDLLDIPLPIAFVEVHRSNMSKLDDEGKPVLRSDGKILKGPNYVPADMSKIFGVSD